MKQQNSKSSVLSLLLVLLLVAVGLFWFKPNLDEASALGAALEVRERDQITKQAELKKLQDASVAIESGSEINKETTLTAIPERLEQDALITQITGIAKKFNIEMSSISFGIPTGGTEAIKKATVNISMTASEAELMKFLKGIESNPRKLVVKNITVQFGSTGDFERVNFTISLETYFQDKI